MDQFVQLVGPHHAVQMRGVKVVGVTAEIAKTLLFFLILLLSLAAGSKLLGILLRRVLPNRDAFGARENFPTSALQK